MKRSPKSTKQAFGDERREGAASAGTSGGSEKDESVNEELDQEERPTTKRPA